MLVFGQLYNRFFFFFFQAEDGIRDIGVTGVQTCALPIFERRADGKRSLALWNCTKLEENKNQKRRFYGICRFRKLSGTNSYGYFSKSVSRKRFSFIG